MDIAGVGQPVRGFLLRIVQYLGREGQLWGVLQVGGGGYDALGGARLGGGGVPAGVAGLGVVWTVDGRDALRCNGFGLSTCVYDRCAGSWPGGPARAANWGDFRGWVC